MPVSPRASELRAEVKERRKPGRVPTSCAECRRLKLRCDRKVPCETCTKRGCAAICPNGSLTAGKGNRMVLANTEELHSQIEIMSSRIRELEDALTILQAEVSDQPHSLLKDTINDLLRESPLSASADPASAGGGTNGDSPDGAEEANGEPKEDAMIDAFGTLAIGSRGEINFTGSTARPEYLLQPVMKPTGDRLILPRLSKQIMDAWLPDFDGQSRPDPNLTRAVMNLLPPLSEAIRLCEIYLEWGKVLWNPLQRSELFDEVIQGVYRAESFESITSSHYLALLFSVFSLAALFDERKSPYSSEAQEYAVLSHVALNFKSPCFETSVHTVHALVHMATYLDLADLKMDSSQSYIMIGFAVKLAYRIGIHLHGIRWNLGEVCVQKRSSMFWHVFMMDTWLSFATGRPPNVSPVWIDVPYPNDEWAVTGDNGSEESFHMWTWKYAVLLHHVMTTAFGGRPPTYATILELDRKVRDFPVPPHLRPRCEGDVLSNGLPMHLQRHFILAYKEATLLNLHRTYFAQALKDKPNDPLKHKYGPSVMAAYRSAWRMIVCQAHSIKTVPKIMERMGIFWSQAFSAAIVMCMIASRCPNSSMAHSSLAELDSVYDTFNKFAPVCKPAQILLEPVKRLWEKGHEAMNSPNGEEASCLTKSELDRIGGGSTQVIASLSFAPDSVVNPHAHPHNHVRANGSANGNYSTASSSPTAYTDASASPNCNGHGVNGVNGVNGACASPSCSVNGGAAGTNEMDTSSGSPEGWSTLNDIHPRIMQDMQVFDGFSQFGNVDYNNPGSGSGSGSGASPQSQQHQHQQQQNHQQHGQQQQNQQQGYLQLPQEPFFTAMTDVQFAASQAPFGAEIYSGPQHLGLSAGSSGQNSNSASGGHGNGQGGSGGGGGGGQGAGQMGIPMGFPAGMLNNFTPAHLVGGASPAPGTGVNAPPGGWHMQDAPVLDAAWQSFVEQLGF